MRWRPVDRSLAHPGLALSGDDGWVCRQMREALDADRFDEVFTAGAQLNQQQAVAAVRDRPRAAR